MWHNLYRTSVTLLLPGGTLFLLTLLLTRQAEAAQWFAPLQHLYPSAVVGAALLLGWRFDRSRLVFAALLFAFALWLLDRHTLRPDASGRIIVDAVGVLLPLNLALLTLLKERGIFTWHGLSRWALILAQPLLVGLLLHYRQYYWLGVFDTPLLPLDWFDTLGLKQPALFALGLSLLVTGVQALRHRHAMEAALFWAVALTGYAQLAPLPAGVEPIALATALLILIVAVIELSYTMAFRDELTGLPGRRALNQTLLKLGNRYTLAMLDVDHFKKFNDSYGHDVGDEVLKMVAAQMARVSGGGKPFRYGGEEFTVVFAGKRIEDALPHLEQVREAIATTAFAVRSSQRPKEKPQTPTQGERRTVQITISIGTAERGAEARTPDAVLKEADKALYRAKKGGRNRVST